MTKTFCYKCDEITDWVPARKNGKREKCGGCGDVFPCHGDCQHLDCAQERRKPLTQLQTAV
jgi:hypothetical protein